MEGQESEFLTFPDHRYNQPMSTTILLLSVFFLAGLLFSGLLLIARGKRARLALFITGLGLVNLGGLAVLFSAFLVSRLDGSRPPALLEFLAGLWAPVGLLVVVNAILILIYSKKR